MEQVESARRRETRARAEEDAAPERYPGRGLVRVQRVEIGRNFLGHKCKLRKTIIVGITVSGWCDPDSP